MTFNSEKVVHVNSYTRRDGTQVKEHYRGISSNEDASFAPEQNENDFWKTTIIPEERTSPIDDLLEKVFKTNSGGIHMNASSNLVLKGGVEVTEFDFSSVLGAIASVAGIAVTAGLGALKAAAVLNYASETSDKATIKKFKPQLYSAIKDIKETQKLFDTAEKMNIDKLVNAKNQEEYSKLYKVLTQQREINSANKNAIARIEYAAENDDFQTVVDELQIYQDNSQAFKDTVSNVKKSVSKTPKLNIELDDNLFNSLRRTGLHKYPNIEKLFLDGGMLTASLKWPNTSELWKASAYNFENSGDYIAKNGYKVNSVSELPSDLQNFVSNKLNEQIGVPDAEGIILKSDSSLSKSILRSKEFKAFLGNNLHKIMAGQSVKGSVAFGDRLADTHYALGHADIIDTFMDSKGNIYAKVIDTYDFNKDDPFFLVEWAHNLQDLKMLKNFFTINILFIPPSEWIKLLY